MNTRRWALRVGVTSHKRPTRGVVESGGIACSPRDMDRITASNIIRVLILERCISNVWKTMNGAESWVARARALRVDPRCRVW